MESLLSRPHRGLLMVLIAAVMLAVVAPVTVDASTSRGSAGPAGPGQPPIDWTTCGSGLECANVPVPLDWRHPDGPTITLAVIRHLASRPGQRIGSLFFNPGGPGDSGAAAVAERGEALTALKYSGLPDPALWPEVTAVFELAAEGDASVLDAIAAGATSDQARVLLQEQGVALVCADSPARHPATAWPGVVRRLAAVSRIGGPPLGWINAPCASWPTSSADRYTGPWNATTKHPILVIGTRFDPNTPWPTPGARHGGWATPSC